MRIAIMTDCYIPELRSNARLFHDLACEFCHRGHDVAVITKVPGDYMEGEVADNPGAGWEEIDGVQVLRVEGSPIPGRHPLVRGLDHLFLGWSFLKASRQWPDADVVIVSSPPLPLMRAAMNYSAFTWIIYLKPKKSPCGDLGKMSSLNGQNRWPGCRRSGNKK